MEANMMGKCWLLLLTILMTVLIVHATQVSFKEEKGVKTAVYLSPKIVMGSGSSSNKWYNNIDFPKGHIGIKSFSAEVVDEKGNPVPLYQTYLHHWIVLKYIALIDKNSVNGLELNTTILRNSGTCQDDVLGQYFGLGSETRRTETDVPDPYAIEAGNPTDTPQGFEERWLFNIHAIDTRDVVDTLGCTECRCDLYNISIEGYIGGLDCCPGESQCKLREGAQNITRDRYLRYTVKFVDWVDTIVPVRIYILDVTDTGERRETSEEPLIGCQIEYDVLPCGVSGHGSRKKCLDRKKSVLVIPKGGSVVYGVGHQHTGAIGSTLYGENGRKLCSSKAIYGDGKEAGNESGYIVGMSTCYPSPGSIRISDGEKLRLTMVNNNTELHTGVMGLFYLLIADYP